MSDDETPIQYVFSQPDAGALIPGEKRTMIVADGQAGWRLDLFLVFHLTTYSRTHIRNAIMAGGAKIVDPDPEIPPTRGRPGYRLKPGQEVTFTLPEIPRSAPKPEPIPIEILYEDDSLLVLNKPPHMVVHPSRGHWDGTLVGALAYHFAGKLSSVRGPERPGIVHRLDRDTSGVILIAKNDNVHSKLAVLFQEKRIVKEYFAIVIGTPGIDRDMIEEPIGPHPKQREKMTVARPDDPEAKEAQTFYEVVERFRGFAAIKVLPKTGRTHQIRVHLTHNGYPILCDRLYYSSRSRITFEEISAKKPIEIGGEPSEGTVLLSRQALHARSLSFIHPESGKELTVTAPLPPDIAAVLEALREYRK